MFCAATSLLLAAIASTDDGACPRNTSCDPISEIESCNVDALGEIRRKILFPRPESDRYDAPDERTLRTIEASILAVLEGKTEDAFGNALGAGYLLCQDEVDGQPVVFWRPMLTLSGLAWFAYRPHGARPLIIEAPHPFYDTGTLKQAIGMFSEVGARVVIVAGTHRCANGAVVECDGRTHVCGGSRQPYRASDMAHVPGSVFHTAHRAFSEAFPEDWVVSLHGMGRRGIIVSDGTDVPTSTVTPAIALTQELRSLFPKERVRSCNDPKKPAVERYCGTTNLQGRHLNDADGDVCFEPATSASGRFIHLEQSRRVRKRWKRVAEAFHRILPGE